MSEVHFEQLTSIDAWFLYLERPEAPLHIGGVYIFEGRSQTPRGRGALGLAKTIESRLHLVPRYRQRVRFLPLNLGNPVWVDDPDFDLSYHVRRAALPKPGDMSVLREYAARVFARPLDLAKSPWEITVVEGLEGGRVALIHKVHHCMVDGISSVDIGTLLFDIDPGGELTELPPAPKRWAPRPGPSESDLVAIEAAALNPVRALRQIFGGGLTRSVKNAVEAAVHSPWSGAASLAFALIRPRRELFFNRRIGPHRRVHHLAVDLDRIKEVKNAFGGSVNDVILAIVAEGLRRWLAERGEEVPDSIRAFCPVSVRDESARYTLGNQVSGMVVELPTGPMPPVTRLATISQTTGDLKRSRQAVAAHSLTGLTGWAPATLQALGARAVAGSPQWLPQSMVNMVVTNVPGPQFPFYTDGAEMVEVWPFVPIYHSMALNIALFSYNRKIHFGLLADRDLVPDLESFARHLGRAAEDLHRLALRLAPEPPVRLPKRSRAADRKAPAVAAGSSESSGSPPPAPTRAAATRGSSKRRG